MLTIFTVPKSFADDHISTIQYNAIKSWTLLKPTPEIVLFGQEDGLDKVAQDLDVRHIPHINSFSQGGVPLVSELFTRIQQESENDIFCYVNADIILLNDLVEAVKLVSQKKKRYLLVGERCDVDIIEPLNFEGDWESDVRQIVLSKGKMLGPIGIDYFVFPRGYFDDLPPFYVGRAAWDNYMVYHALAHHIPVIDATPSILAIHQNHDYRHHPEGRQGTYVTGVEAQHNHKLYNSIIRGYRFLLPEATHELIEQRLRRRQIRLTLRMRLKRFAALYRSKSSMINLLVQFWDGLLHIRRRTMKVVRKFGRSKL